MEGEEIEVTFPAGCDRADGRGDVSVGTIAQREPGRSENKE
jgi:hypothetical protein